MMINSIANSPRGCTQGLSLRQICLRVKDEVRSLFRRLHPQAIREKMSSQVDRIRSPKAIRQLGYTMLTMLTFTALSGICNNITPPTQESLAHVIAAEVPWPAALLVVGTSLIVFFALSGLNVNASAQSSAQIEEDATPLLAKREDKPPRFKLFLVEVARALCRLALSLFLRTIPFVAGVLAATAISPGWTVGLILAFLILLACAVYVYPDKVEKPPLSAGRQLEPSLSTSSQPLETKGNFSLRSAAFNLFKVLSAMSLSILVTHLQVFAFISPLLGWPVIIGIGLAALILTVGALALASVIQSPHYACLFLAEGLRVVAAVSFGAVCVKLGVFALLTALNPCLAVIIAIVVFVLLTALALFILPRNTPLDSSTAPTYEEQDGGHHGGGDYVMVDFFHH